MAVSRGGGITILGYGPSYSCYIYSINLLGLIFFSRTTLLTIGDFKHG